MFRHLKRCAIGMLATLLTAMASPQLAQAQTRLSIRTGLASATAGHGRGWESGPELAVGVSRWLSRSAGLEGHL
ncbi:MAG: hypothetical protein SGI84_08870 [Gemmatimonadota bacterium]|nr:hypothetical protein [Gemmatimonadota bacterium]